MSFTVTKPGEVQPIEPPPPPGQPCDLPKGIGRIEGFVKGEDGAIANIGVRLTHPTGCHRINFTVKTGWFIFDNIGAGLYGIEVVDAEARGYTKSGHPAIDLREGGKHVAYIGIGKLYSGPPTEPIVCPTYIRAEEVCGQVGEKLVTFNSPCELRQARAQYFYHGRCKTTPDIIEKICPQVWEPVCGKDGQTYSNKCYADGVTEIAFAGTCEKPKPGPLPEPIDGDDENSDILKGIPHFIAMVQERLAQLAQYVGTVADPKEQASAATLQGDVAGQLKELLEAVGNQDVSRIKLLGTKLDRVLHAIEEKISGFTKKYTKDIIRNSTRVSKALVKRYAAPAPEDEGSLFGDDITHLRVKAEKQAAILERAQRAFERGDKKLAQSLVRDAEATFGADEYGATGDAKYVEAPGLEKVLADVRNGLNAAWEGVSAAKERGIEADPLLLALLQKAETVYQQAVTALKNGKPEEVGPLLGSLKSLGLQEKFVNFRGGSGRPELAQSRWEDILADAEKSRSYVAKGIPELARRGGDTTGLTEILARLTKLITEARRAFAAEDKRLGFQLVDEIAAMDVQQVLADIFRNLGHDDFKGEISETLREAPNYIAAMSKVIENLRDRGEDVAMYENLLAAAEAARVKGQAAVDAGDAKGAEEAVQRMFGPAMK
ncbi:hypothetical protein HY629_00370, partial [Candidatus Uhrbacteria bacterium]|nr:hypothetical protein [Candidatus Uhrbacteria bacterium]